jgi:lipoate synthase
MKFLIAGAVCARGLRFGAVVPGAARRAATQTESAETAEVPPDCL